MYVYIYIYIYMAPPSVEVLYTVTAAAPSTCAGADTLPVNTCLNNVCV